MNLSIVITCREDPLLDWTIGNILTSVGGSPEIIVVFDGADSMRAVAGASRVLCTGLMPLGVQAARDMGIKEATRGNVVVMDAHMNFHEGRNWGDIITRHLSANPTDVCCFFCGWLTDEEPGRLDMPADGKGFYAGCDIRTFCVEPNGEHVPLGGKWRTSQDCGEIACVMGGMYAFRRDHYLGRLARCWELGTSWGHDEETISAINWCLGGRNVLLPVETGHVFRSKPSYKQDAKHHIAGIWANRMRLWEMLPVSKELYQRAQEFFAVNRMVRLFRAYVDQKINPVLAHKKCEEYMLAGSRTLDEYLKHWGAL